MKNLYLLKFHMPCSTYYMANYYNMQINKNLNLTSKMLILLPHICDQCNTIQFLNVFNEINSLLNVSSPQLLTMQLNNDTGNETSWRQLC
jgi:hypothetical protein